MKRIFSVMGRGVLAIGRVLGIAGRATIALVGICGVAAVLANYTMTQGAGTTFGSIVVGGVNYAQQFICDMTTPSQCAAVDTHGQQLVDVNTTNNNLYAAMTAAVPCLSVTAWNTTSPYTTGTTNPANCNLTGGLYVDLSKHAGTAGTANSNIFTMQGIASMTPILSNPGTAANWGVGATASAPPANAVYLGANASGATGGKMAGLISCDNFVFKHITSATDTLAVQGVASQTIYICGFHARAAGTATWFLENTASANANCSSSNTQIDVLNSEAANSGVVDHTPFWSGLKNTSGNGLCINSTGTGGVDVGIYYTQF